LLATRPASMPGFSPLNTISNSLTIALLGPFRFTAKVHTSWNNKHNPTMMARLSAVPCFSVVAYWWIM
jgi:hypothetical protein